MSTTTGETGVGQFLEQMLGERSLQNSTILMLQLSIVLLAAAFSIIGAIAAIRHPKNPFRKKP